MMDKSGDDRRAQRIAFPAPAKCTRIVGYRLFTLEFPVRG